MPDVQMFRFRAYAGYIVRGRPLSMVVSDTVQKTYTWLNIIYIFVISRFKLLSK